MGAVFSTTNPCFLNDSVRLEEAFENGLKAATDVGKSGIRRQLSAGILHRITSVSTTESTASDFIGIESNENSKSELQTITSGFTAHQTNNSTRNSASAMRIRSNKSLDINKNPTVVEKKTEPGYRMQTTSVDGIMRQNVTAKPFQPESWPTLEMVHEQLSKHQTPPSTLIFARFLPHRSRKYVEIRYSVTDATNEIIFESSDKLETLVAPKEHFKKGDTKEDEVKYFLLIFKTCMNNLQGQVWWNGISLILDPNLKIRLKVSALETQPISQILFELTGMKELELHRSSHRVELRGQVDGSTENMAKVSKYIRFRGVDTKDIKVKQLRGHLVTAHIPAFDFTIHNILNMYDSTVIASM